MAVVDVSNNTAFVVEPFGQPAVVDSNALAVIVEVPPGDVQVEFTTAATLVPGSHLVGGGYMIGEVDINLKPTVIAQIDGAAQADDLHAVAFSGDYNDLEHKPTIPVLPSNPLVVGMMMLWYGVAAACPLGWLICDGTFGTPDMRNRVPIGASGTRALGSTAGSATAAGTTGSGGAHTPTGSIGGHALTAAEGPVHTHRPLVVTANADYAVHNGFNYTGQTHTAITGKGGVARGYLANNFQGDQLLENSGAGDAHVHPLTLNSVATHTHALSTISVMQPDRAVHYIIYAGV